MKSAGVNVPALWGKEQGPAPVFTAHGQQIIWPSLLPHSCICCQVGHELQLRSGGLFYFSSLLVPARKIFRHRDWQVEYLGSPILFADFNALLLLLSDTLRR
jgi:hypothetical protein